MASQRIHIEHTQKKVEQLCEEIRSALDPSLPDSERFMIIPDHQRHAGVWPLSRKQMLITSIRLNHPIPSILLGSIHKQTLHSLEDGLQRLKTLLEFYQNEITDTDYRTFNDYTPKERSDFLNYSITVVKYSGATEEARIQIFDNHQNGSPLKEGERLYAHCASRLVSFTIRMLLTPGSGLFDRFSAVWGVRGGERDKKNRRKDLHQAVSLMAGVIFGPHYLTKKYETLKTVLMREFDELAAAKALMRLLEVYEAVQEQCPCMNAWINRQFDAGQFSGYIIYSMFHDPVSGSAKDAICDNVDWEPIKREWVRFMVRVRRDADQKSKNMTKVLMRSLHKDVGKGRIWTLQRWMLGYLRIFDPENELLKLQKESEEETEDEDD